MTHPVSPTAQPVPTGQGPAAVRVFPAAPVALAAPGVPVHPASARGTVLVGHGAGGQRDAADVLALTGLTSEGWTVVLVDQPWRVAGRRVATAPPTLDLAWSQVVAGLEETGCTPDGTDLPRPWVYAGRSAGARVACRTSLQTTPPAAAVVALAFPLHPPGRPGRSRVAELAAPVRAGVPTLVVQGGPDPMGTPAEIRSALGDRLSDRLTLHEVPGTHSPTRDLTALQRHVREFLERLGEDDGDAPEESRPGATPSITGPDAQSAVASVGRTPSRTGDPSP